jgi:DNA primase
MRAVTPPRSFIGRLAKAFDLYSYIHQEPRKPKKYGSNEYALTCPVCDKTERLWVNTEKRVSTCYYCRKGWDVVGLIQILENCNLIRVIEILKDHSAGATVNLRQEVDRVLKALAADDSREDADQVELPTVSLPQGFIPAFEADELPPYFAERGISRAQAIRYDLGWTEEGFYRKRLIVPVVQDGRLVSFHARYMKKKPPITVCETCGGDGRDEDGETCSHCEGKKRSRPKKVRYPKGSKTSYMLYNYDRSRSCRRIVIVEDTFSTMALGTGRITGGVGSFGTSISPHQLAMLLATDAEEMVFLWDRDAIDKAYEEAERLAEFWTTKVVELPDDRDPDEYPNRKSLLELVDSAKATGAARFTARIKARLRKM